MSNDLWRLRRLYLLLCIWKAYFFSPEWLINRLTQSRKDENCCQLEVLVRWKLGKTFAVEIDAKRAWTKKNEKERKMNWSGIKGKSNLKFFLRQTSFHALAFRCKLSQWRIHISFRLRHKNAPSRCYCCYLSLFSLFPTWMLGIVVDLQQKVQKLFRVELKISRKKEWMFRCCAIWSFYIRKWAH